IASQFGLIVTEPSVCIKERRCRMLGRILLILTFISLNGFANESKSILRDSESENVSELRAQDLSEMVPLVNARLQASRRPPSNGDILPSVQPEARLQFEYSSQWPETIIIRKVSKNWSDDSLYGHRVSFVAA